MMANTGVAIARISGTVDRRCQASSSIIRRRSCAWQTVSDSQAKSSGSSSQPSGVTKRSPRKEKAGPRAGPVNTVERVELNHAAISSLAGDLRRRQEASQRPSHCHAEPTKAHIRRILHFA